MTRIIKIGEKQIPLSNNSAWLLEYKDAFGQDILPAIMPLITTLIETVATAIANPGEGGITVQSVGEALQGRTIDVMVPLYQLEVTEIQKITWAMAKTADEDIPPLKNWLRTFDVFPLDVIVPELADLITKGFVSSKNLKRLKTKTTEAAKAAAKRLQPSQQTTSSSPLSSAG